MFCFPNKGRLFRLGNRRYVGEIIMSSNFCFFFFIYAKEFLPRTRPQPPNVKFTPRVLDYYKNVLKI